MSQVRHALFIQGVTAFISGTLSILIPIVLLERNISIQDIGLIFAIYPIVFQLGRISFGVISDFAGRKLFYALNSGFNFVTSIIYYFSFSPIGYAFGKFTEGLRDASLWSVNRPFFMEQRKRSHHKENYLLNMRTVELVFNSIGTFAVGFLLTFLFFSNVLLFCAFLSLITLPSALVLKDKVRKKINFSRIIRNLSFRKKKSIYKKFFLLFCIMAICDGLTSGYIFPAFLKLNGFDVKSIGILLGLQTLLSGVCIFFFRRFRNVRKIVFFSGLLSFILFVPMGFVSYSSIWILIILLGIVGSAEGIGFEIIMTRITHERSYAGDIALLFIGYYTVRTVIVAVSGFLIASLGFGAVFLIVASIGLVYSTFAALQFKR
jgi:MFS family permease